MPVTPLSIVIAEDQTALRTAMARSVTAAGYNVIGECIEGNTAQVLVRRLRPSVLIIRKDLPLISGVRCCQVLRQTFGSEIGLLLTLSRPSDLWDALESGANGYIMRETRLELLAYAVKQVDAGAGWIGPDIAHYLVSGRGLPLLRSASRRFNSAPNLNVLSDREQDVLTLLIDGTSNQHIADTLGLKLQTVKVHVKSILKKMQAESRSQLISRVLQSGIAGASTLEVAPEADWR